MPDPALPVPQAGSTRFLRRYADALGRAMVGRLSLTPVDVQGVLPVPVVVELADGVAAASVPPGTYLLSGILRTTNRDAVVISERVTLD